MAAPTPAKSINLSVSNFGPIIEADIDLRPLTVFVGPSNTGKSYMAILIYALQRFFSEIEPLRLTLSDLEASGVADIYDIPQNVLQDMDVWLEQSERISESEPFPPVPELVESLVLRSLDISEYGDIFTEEVLRCFGKDSPERLIRHGSGTEAKISIKSSVPEGSIAVSTLEYEIAMSENVGNDFHSDIPKAVSPEIANRAVRSYLRQNPLLPSPIRRRVRGRRMAYTAHRALRPLAAAVGEEFIAPLSNPVHYLPADRTGIMHAHQVVVASLISRASLAGLRRDDPLPVLSGVLADFLKSLITLNERPRLLERRTHDFAHRRAANRIEKGMLAGDVQITKSAADYPEFHYRPSGWKEPLPLMSASSMVSELAPVVLYLRYVVRPGDTLIIEEPESHLHPAMQVEFIRQLAAVTLAGVRVIITTHSEWVLDQLSNLTLLSQLDESNRDGIPGADCALDPESVGVWLFRPEAEGSIVEEIPFVDEYGGYSEDFNVIGLDSYNSHAEIFNRAQEAKGE